MNLPAVQNSNLPATEVMGSVVESVMIGGDLSKLKPFERVNYYKSVCDSLNLNPLTRPFDYVSLKGKLTLYAKKDATEQLRRLHNVSVKIISREVLDGVYIVTAQATMQNGRTDEAIGAVFIGGARGEDMANAIMKAETKAKRRVTLSICGLGFVDETEIEGVKGAHFISAEVAESENFVPPVEVEYDAQPAEEKLKKLEEKVTKITPNPVETKKPEGQPSKQQLNYLLSQAKEKMQWETHQITLYLQRKYGLQSSVGLSMDQYAELFKIVTTTNYALAIAELDRKDKESLKNG